LELTEVAVFVVGLAVLPAADEDADPIERQGTDRGVVAVSGSTRLSGTGKR
jgi:hypothetical protein